MVIPPACSRGFRMLSSSRKPSVSVELSSDEETKIQRKERRKRERNEEHIHSIPAWHGLGRITNPAGGAEVVYRICSRMLM